MMTIIACWLSDTQDDSSVEVKQYYDEIVFMDLIEPRYVEQIFLRTP